MFMLLNRLFEKTLASEEIDALLYPFCKINLHMLMALKKIFVDQVIFRLI